MTKIANEVSLRDVLVAFIKRWKFVLMFSLCCAFSIGVIGMVYHVVNNRENLLGEFDEYNVVIVENDFQDAMSRLRNRQEYMVNSFYYNLDDSNVVLTRGVFLVEVPDWQPSLSGREVETTTDPISDLVSGYVYLTQDAECVDRLCTLLGTDNRYYVMELVSTSKVEGQNLFQISVRSDSEQQSQEILQSMWNYLQENSDRFLTEHSITMVAQSTWTREDNTVRDYKTQYRADTQALISNVETLTSQVSVMRIQDATEIDIASLIKAGIVFAVIGLMLGASMALFWIMCVLFLNTSLRSPNQISDTYGLPILGFIKVTKRGEIRQ